MTQENLAEALGLTTGHMTAIENGYTGISLPKFIEVSEIFDVSADRLLGLSCDPNDLLYSEITRLLKNCDENELELMLAVLRTIKSNWKR